ncbi:MAG: hypothetical protein U9R54_01865 [Bacteroidota bacterium]|nr:hypothetical protein [Bacteroidota bacterium]
MNKKDTNTKNPFTVPENYFDNLAINVQDKLSDTSSEYSIMQKIILYTKPQITLGLIIVAFAIIGYLTINTIWNNYPLTNQQINEFATIDEINASEFTEQDYLNILLEEKSATNKTNKNTDEYIKYLVDEEIDYGTIMNELYYY